MDYALPEHNAADYGEEEPQQHEAHYGPDDGNYDSIDDNNIDESAANLKHDSSSSAGKLFVGGIAWETSEEGFSRYFRKYGEITDSVIMMDKVTGRPRGFGFVTFADPEVADRVLREEHVIDGRGVEVKRTVPREDGQGSNRGGFSRTKKIFVGGLPLSLNEEDLREYFSSYGEIVEHQIMLDHTTGRSRGFGFVTFVSEDAVEKIFNEGRMHELGGKQVEIKRAEPKRPGFDQLSEGRFRRGSSSSRSSGSFGGGYGGGKMGRGYGGYDGYGVYGGYGNFGGSYPGGAAGYYAGYGGYGYGYGYGFGGPMYSGGAYGGGGFGAPVGYGGAAAGYGVGGKAYGGRGYDGGEGGFGGSGSGSGGAYGPAKGYGGSSGSSGGYGGGKGYGNGNVTGGRFHPYRK